MKRFGALIMAAALMLMSTSCNIIVKNSEEQFDYPVTIGNLTLSQAPQNIAVLSANLADVALACGFEGKIAAVSSDCTQEELSILPSVGTPDSPDVRELSDMGADLILADECFAPEIQEKIDALNVPVLVVKPAEDMTSLSKLYNNTAAALAGGYTGKMQAMSSYEKLRAELEEIKSYTGSQNVVITTCYIYDVTEDECIVASGNDFANRLFEYTSLTNIAAGDDDGVIGIDTLLKGNPDVIFCDEGVYTKIAANKDFKPLKALTQGKVVELPKKYLSLQGATCLQTADFIATKSHDGYEQTKQWPEELMQEEEKVEYVPPFEPQKDIFYTVGESYEPIKAIEERLIGLGYLQGSADADFTEETAEAVSEFQFANAIEVTGIADYATLKVLLSSKAISKKDAGEVTYNAD